jgi:hypothetical protein
MFRDQMFTRQDVLNKAVNDALYFVADEKAAQADGRTFRFYIDFIEGKWRSMAECPIPKEILKDYRESAKANRAANRRQMRRWGVSKAVQQKWAREARAANRKAQRRK